MNAATTTSEMNISIYIATQWETVHPEIKQLFAREADLRKQVPTWTDDQSASTTPTTTSLQAFDPALLQSMLTTDIPPEEMYIEQLDVSDSFDFHAIQCVSTNSPIPQLVLEEPSPEEARQHRATLIAERRVERQRRKLAKKVKQLEREIRERELRKQWRKDVAGRRRRLMSGSAAAILARKA